MNKKLRLKRKLKDFKYRQKFISAKQKRRKHKSNKILLKDQDATDNLEY